MSKPVVRTHFTPGASQPGGKLIETELQAAAYEELFPGDAVVVVGDSDAQYASLMAPEKACVRNAVEKRVREFTAGRACARRALARLDIRDHPLVSGPDRAPVWPEGVVGSITHCQDFVAAVVARREDARGLGIDAEPVGPVDEALVPLICTRDERDWLAGVGPGWSRTLFSAKESVFKCLHPITGTWIDFLDVSIAIDPAGRQFEIHPARDAPAVARSVLGRFVRTPTHWVTAATVA